MADICSMFWAGTTKCLNKYRLLLVNKSIKVNWLEEGNMICKVCEPPEMSLGPASKIL